MYCNIERAQRVRRRYRFNGLRLIKTLIFLGVIFFIIFSGSYIIKNTNRIKLERVLPFSAEKPNPPREPEDKINKIDKDSQKVENLPEKVEPKTEAVIPPSENNEPHVIKPQKEKSDNEKQQTPSQKHYDEFFPDTVFVGDSITEGIPFFEIIDGSKVVSEKGYTIRKAQKDINKITEARPQHIFVQLGLNDMLYDISSEKFAEDYSEFIQNINTALPETDIYVQSIFPVSEELEKKRPELSNAKIEEFNGAIKKMAEEAKVRFVDVALILKDADGRMNPEYTSDGIHLEYRSYILWFDYLKDTVVLSAGSDKEIEGQ